MVSYRSGSGTFSRDADKYYTGWEHITDTLTYWPNNLTQKQDSFDCYFCFLQLRPIPFEILKPKGADWKTNPHTGEHRQTDRWTDRHY